jgi:hypothetical protein
MRESKTVRLPSPDLPSDATVVSALIDGELPAADLLAALQQVAADVNLSRTWERYYLLREAIRGGLSNDYLPDFAEKVMTVIDALPNAQPVQAVADADNKKNIKRAEGVRFWWPTLALASTFGLILLLWPAVTPVFNNFPQSSLTASLPVRTQPAERVTVRPLSLQELDAEWQTLLREHAAYQEVLPVMLPYTRMPMLRTAAAP